MAAATTVDFNPNRARYWCWTAQVEPDVPDMVYQTLVNTLLTMARCVYVIFSLEKAETGQYHLQGYTCFATPVVFTRFCKNMLEALGKAPHVKARWSTHSKARDYCRKEDTHVSGPYVAGDDTDIPEEGGSRSDISRFCKRILEHEPMTTLVADDPVTYVRNMRGLEALRYKTIVAYLGERTVIWYYGDPDAGKTRLANEYDSELYRVFQFGKTAQWFEGYDGERTILIDNLVDDDCNWTMLMQVLDRYKERMPVKTASVVAGWSTVLITSTSDPMQFAAQFSKRKPWELGRRISQIYHVTTTAMDGMTKTRMHWINQFSTALLPSAIQSEDLDDGPTTSGPTTTPPSTGSTDVIPLVDCDTGVVSGFQPNGYIYPRPSQNE